MDLLLDTHTFLWALVDAGLSPLARASLLSPENVLYFSAVSYWEICIKLNIGKLVLASDWDKEFERFMLLNHIRWLPIEKEHMRAILALPMLHRDPFDRLLIAQAQYENMAIVTRDINIARYDVTTIW